MLHSPRILAVVGVQEELLLLLNRIPCSFDSELRLHRCRAFRSLSFFVGGAGLNRRRELRRILEEDQPTVIVSLGLVGLLDERSELEVGDRVRIAEVLDCAQSIVYPGGPGSARLATVHRPLFEPWQKHDLMVQTRSQICDMEAAHLLRIVGQSEASSEDTVVILCKVVGDRPEAWNLYADESLTRGWARKSRLQQLAIALRFPGGPLRLRKLLQAKERGLASLASHGEILIRRLLAGGGPGDWADSVFMPN
ncbi:MAG: hypothetical protein K1X75_11340 [Leptospirales bacterium]|nr:hypothetical protein [Leptospirales bacterium]